MPTDQPAQPFTHESAQGVAEPPARYRHQAPPRSSAPGRLNEVRTVTYRGGWPGLFGGENQQKALERALPEINGDGFRVVAVVRDRWSIWKRIGVVLLLVVTLGFVGRVPNVLLITEPILGT